MKVGVWYNMNPAAMWKGWQPSDALYKVTELYLHNTDTGLTGWQDVIFRIMNMVDEDDLPGKIGCRSMSVGDMLEVDGDFWQCKNTGWALEIINLKL